VGKINNMKIKSSFENGSYIFEKNFLLYTKTQISKKTENTEKYKNFLSILDTI
jgi:hypothetical protein